MTPKQFDDAREALAVAADEYDRRAEDSALGSKYRRGYRLRGQEIRELLAVLRS
jgi:hypothetical protein